MATRKAKAAPEGEEAKPAARATRAAGAKAKAKSPAKGRATKAKAPVLAGLRAPGHRAFIGAEFGAFGDVGGPEDDPVGLTYLEIMADPRLAALGRRVFDDLRRQFASDPVRETDEEEAYRQRLETWADALETLLEEVLDELATLGSARAADASDPVALP